MRDDRSDVICRRCRLLTMEMCICSFEEKKPLAFSEIKEYGSAKAQASAALEASLSQ